MSEQDFVKQLTQLDGEGISETDELARLEPFTPVAPISNPMRSTDDVRTDYQTVRSSLHIQHQMLLEAAKVALEFARNTESPRAMEGFATIMRQLSEVNTSMTGFHSEMLKLEEARRKLEGQEATKLVESNGTFYGNPLDMMEEEGSLAEAKRMETYEHDD